MALQRDAAVQCRTGDARESDVATRGGNKRSKKAETDDIFENDRGMNALVDVA